MSDIVIGAGFGTEFRPGSDVMVLPGEEYQPQERVTFHPVQSLKECMDVIRHRYATHEQIVKLGSAALVSDHPTPSAAIRDQWMPEIDAHLERIIDEMGNCPMDSWNGAHNAIRQGGYLETCPNTDSLVNVLAGKPAICLGAGPTAQAYLSRINPKTHYVFCCDAMLAGCGFVPHFTTIVERTPGNFDMMASAAGRGSRLIALPVVDPRAAVAFNGKCLWWMGADLIYPWLAPHIGHAYGGRSSGSLSIAAALLAGCNPIYLIGHDLAYAGDKTHADASHDISREGHRLPTQTAMEIFHLRKCLVEGTGGGLVESCGLFSAFRQDIEVILQAYPDRTVINCGGLSPIRGTVMGDLGESFEEVSEPTYTIDPISSRLPDIPRIVDNMRRIQLACSDAVEDLTSGANTEIVARDLVVSNMVDHDMAKLFNYIFRPISNNLNMRLEYRFSKGSDPVAIHREALRRLAVTMYYMCEKMAVQLVA